MTKLPSLLQIPLTLQIRLMGQRPHFPPEGQSKILSAERSETIGAFVGLCFSYKTKTTEREDVFLTQDGPDSL